VAELSCRFGHDEAETKKRIDEAVEFFKELGAEGQGTVEVYLSPRAPLFSVYVFQSAAVLALFNHRAEQGTVITFTMNGEGSIYRYIIDELEAIRAQSRSVT